jgi:hypothetical protein
MLLTFRPFLIFRGHWQRDLKMSLNRSKVNTTNRPTETPSWLNEACNHATTAAQKTIHHLCEASRLNDLVRVSEMSVVSNPPTNHDIATSLPRLFYRKFHFHPHLRIYS